VNAARLGASLCLYTERPERLEPLADQLADCTGLAPLFSDQHRVESDLAVLLEGDESYQIRARLILDLSGGACRIVEGRAFSGLTLRLPPPLADELPPALSEQEKAVLLYLVLGGEQLATFRLDRLIPS
ncbi:MAG: hypothetical protein IJF59_01180, partial [Clostridia bacterium]|nr:hypothetical protein [Clostridia bacterium]